MRARQIPVGMEAFTANDDRGWGVIQATINLSDYYVVIVAGRYGAIDEKEGISWTEKEYRYAKEIGLKTMAFIRKDASIVMDAVDKGTDPKKVRKAQAKLADFKSLLKNSHLVQFWGTPEELARMVGEAVRNQIQDDEGDGTAPPGWHRGGNAEVAVGELARLSSENRDLRGRLAAVESERSVSFSIRDGWDTYDGTVWSPMHEPRRLRIDEVELEVEPPSALRSLAVTTPPIAAVRRYLKAISNAVEVALVIENTGTKQATDVEVRIASEDAGGMWLDIIRPRRIPVAPTVDQRTNGSRNVNFETVDNNGVAWTARQRVKVLAPGSDANLVKFNIAVDSQKEDRSFLVTSWNEMRSGR